MMWEKTKLYNCCECITDGDHLPPPKATNGIPFITIANINDLNQIDFSNTMFVPQNYYDNLKETRKAKANDVLYSVVGSFGIPVRIKEAKQFCFQRHIALLRPNTIDSRFLYYTMKSKAFFYKADAVALGAAQRTISLSALRNIEIDVPSLDTQRRIADTLSAYDDLIENNQKQIKLLEEAAMRLYKEWFVNLRFPGHENTNVVAGVPDGWERAPSRKYIKLNYGKALQENKRRGQKYPVYGSSGIVGYHDAYLVEAPAIIVGRKGNVGSIFWSFDNAYPIDTVYYITTTLSPYYVFFELLTRSFISSDSAVPGLNRTYAESMEMLCPCANVLNDFEHRVYPLFMLRYTLDSRIKYLQQARDMLLPKMMSGEIEV